MPANTYTEETQRSGDLSEVIMHSEREVGARGGLGPLSEAEPVRSE